MLELVGKYRNGGYRKQRVLKSTTAVYRISLASAFVRGGE